MDILKRAAVPGLAIGIGLALIFHDGETRVVGCMLVCFTLGLMLRRWSDRD